MAAQACTRAVGDDTCIFHPGQKLIYKCTDCKGELACIMCANSVHREHRLPAIKEAVKGSVARIKHFISTTKERTLPDMVIEIQQTEKTLKEYEQECRGKIEEVTKEEIYLKNLVERYSRSKKDSLQCQLKETTDMLSVHKQNLDKTRKELLKDTKEYQHNLKLESTHDVLLYDMEIEIAKKAAQVQPKMPVVKPPLFSPCRNPKQYIEKAFQEVIEEKEKCENEESSRVIPEYTFLDQPKTLFESPTSFEVKFSGICCLPDNNACVLGWDAKLHLIDNLGQEGETFQPDVEINGICIHPSTLEMYCTAKDNSIRRIDTKETQSRVLFYTEREPLAITCTEDNQMVVLTMNNTVTMLSFIGEVRHTYKYTGKERTQSLSVCSNTNNIALLCGKDGVVTVLNRSLQRLYECKGSENDIKPFCPLTAVYVDRHLLVGDRHNKRILVFDRDRLVHTIHVDEMTEVVALSVRQDGALFVGCLYSDKMLCIQYREDFR